MKQFILLFSIRAALLLLTCVRANGANPAFDSAANSVYDSGWQTGQNGGVGFGAWSISADYAFIASSTTNGVGDPGADGDIDTAGRAWGLATQLPAFNNHSASFAARSFDGALTLGQQFVIDIDTISSGSPVAGFDLLDGNGNAPFDLMISGGGIFVQGGSVGVSPSDQGFHIVFTLTGASSFNVMISGIGNDPPSGLPVSINGSLGAVSGAGLVGVSFFAVDTGPDTANWNFFNSMAIIPEPSTLALLASALALLIPTFRMRRRRM